MMREGQSGEPFYADVDNFTCVGPIITGMAETDPVFESGHIGEELHIFEEARANRRLYHYITKLERDSVRYVVFSPLDKLTYDPDVLILASDNRHLEIILRAMCFATGKMWSSVGTPVIACSWLLTYPYISGEINFNITGISLGMQALEVFPPGLILLSIPWTKIPMMIHNLETMSWDLISHKVTGEAHKERFKKLGAELREKMNCDG